MIKQSGLIITPSPSPNDWIMGAESGIIPVVRRSDSDWRNFIPSSEAQRDIDFDTCSCVTFSATNVIETFLNYYIANGLLSQDHLDFLKVFRFIDVNNKINISDRFTAIMSGTTALGNTVPTVANSIKNTGLLSEKDFPFGGINFAQYQDRTKISNYMIARAKKFLNYFSTNFEWVMFAAGNQNSSSESQVLSAALKEAPLQICVPITAYHAEELLQLIPGGKKTYYDSYPPFLEEYDPALWPIQCALKYVILPLSNPPKLPSVSIHSQLKLGMTSLEVTNLQKLLSYLGFMNLVTGYFGSITEAAVKEFQNFYGITIAGEVGPQTLAKLKEIFGDNALLNATIEVESGGNDNAIGDLTLTNHAYGCLQTRQGVVDDVNKYLGTNYKAQDCHGNRNLSILIYNTYWKVHTALVTYEDRAKGWNGGPGWKSLYGKPGHETYTKNLDIYWEKIQRYL